jgi:hypothetical protein
VLASTTTTPRNLPLGSSATRLRFGGRPISRLQPVCVNLSKESMTKPELLRRHVSKREFWM